MDYHPLINKLFVINVTENTGIIITAYGTVYTCKKATQVTEHLTVTRLTSLDYDGITRYVEILKNAKYIDGLIISKRDERNKTHSRKMRDRWSDYITRHGCHQYVATGARTKVSG